MAQFIDFEVEVSDTEKVEDDEDEVCSNNSLNSFINDSTNLLTNVSYRRYNLKDEKRSFYIVFFSYILLNLNPIGLDRKLDPNFERNQLKMIWDVCVPRSFTKYIFKEDNFTELSKQSLLLTLS